MFLKRKRVSFFTKVFAFSSVIVVFTLLINYIANIILLDQFYIYRKKKIMLNVIERAKNYLEKGEERELKEYIYQIRELEGIEINVERRNPMSMMNHMSMMNNHMLMKSKIPLNEFSMGKIPGVGALILYYGEKLPDGNSMYVSTSLSVMNAHKHESNLFNLITGFFALIFSMFAGAFFSKKITGDIAILSEKADRISQMDFPENIEIERNDEIGDLSRSLDKMSQNLSKSVSNLKSFVSTASHELRTPISIILTHATALLQGKIEERDEIKRYNSIILKETLEMRELTENLLIISKLDSANYGIKKEKIDFLEIIKHAMERYDFLEMEKDLQIVIDVDKREIDSDSKLLKLALDNIIQNAFRYSPYGGKVQIFQNESYLIIKNEIEKKIYIDVEEILQPFSRGKNAEEMGVDGIGLGLSIIKKSLELNRIPFKISVEEDFFVVKLELFGS